jgi:hypothetical protein
LNTNQSYTPKIKYQTNIILLIKEQTKFSIIMLKSRVHTETRIIRV